MTARAKKIDAWIEEGGWIIAGSERAARALRQAYNERRIDEGIAAWREARILEWKAFLQECQRRTGAGSGSMHLNALQEESLWEEVLSQSTNVPAVTLRGPRKKLALLAAEAYALLCGYAEEFIHAEKRMGWAPEFAVYSDWISQFEAACEQHSVMSSQRIAGAVADHMEADSQSDPSPRARLLLVGFDRLLPIQRRVLAAWGEYQILPPGSVAADRHLYVAADRDSELTACARWCAEGLQQKHWKRILVVTPSNPAERGKIERIFRRSLGEDFEFSLGRALASIGPVRAALLMLRWLGGELREAEVDWLAGSGEAGNRRESKAITAAMHKLRDKHREQRGWKLEELIDASRTASPLIDLWVDRMLAARAEWSKFSASKLTPLEWGEVVHRLLEQMSARLARPQSSVEYQAVKQFNELIESCATLGFSGCQFEWWDYLSVLADQAKENLFAIQSEAAPVLIAGPAESAGLEADAVWFLGVSEEGWPRSAEAHPLLPLDLQRQCGMPHSSAKVDWRQAEAVTARLLGAAPHFVASYARVTEDGESKASRMLTRICGEAVELPPQYRDDRECTANLEEIYDTGEVALEDPVVPGGAGLISAQSQCPFKAFVQGRLQASTWQHAEEGLSSATRGNLIHDTLHRIWSKDKGGISSLAELLAIGDRQAFVANHVDHVMTQLPQAIRDRMPRRYLELERKRLESLICNWLDYESTRLPFRAKACEVKREIEIEGLQLQLRLDRLDEAANGKVMVLDYKSGKLSPKQWDPPRPQDLQLPLYACKALKDDEKIEGLSFALIRPDGMIFAGLFRNATETLIDDLKNISALVKTPLTDDRLEEWNSILAGVARDFRAGLATVDPIDRRLNCGRCSYQALCRIEENDALGDEDAEENNSDAEEIANA